MDRLVSRGHVERQPHPGDRRRTELVLTDSGRREVVGHLMPMFVALDRLDRSFTEEERVVVERYLRGALAAFDQVLASGEPGASVVLAGLAVRDERGTDDAGAVLQRGGDHLGLHLDEVAELLPRLARPRRR